MRQDLEGQTVLLTAGPTQEDLDPVRFLTNRSSGKMGYAVAEAAARRGAKVILISGPTALENPAGVTRIDVRTAAEMLNAVQKHVPEATTAIFAAAVADYRPAEAAAHKIKKTGGEFTLRLEPNPDILATIARKKGERLIVGFAAETDKVAENARKKLKEKDADLIVANDVTAAGAGFDVDTNVVTLFARDGRDLALPKLTKREVADRILDEVVRLSASVKHQSAD
jgi:phosphopantothenoylcysteine decarboxylase / phosphopantothenate---cysteine ligase